MCILAFVTRYCERFPFILIGNRDEILMRATATLAHDPATGFVWAVDHLAGGSWMGIEPHSARFAILTNCRRAPTAPLLLPLHDRPSAEVRRSNADTWRGAAPLANIMAHTAVVPVPTATAAPPQQHLQGRAATLLYNPLTSRGTLIADFLRCGSVPGDGDDGTSELPAVVRGPPHYAGFNLLTCEDLRTPEPSVAYTTNRYGAEHRGRVAPGVVHALQNSFLDNTQAEPITDRLRQLFTDALASVIDPLASRGAAAEFCNPVTPEAVADVATALVDACLCDRCNFDVSTIALESPAVQAQLHAASPSLGLAPAELGELADRTGSGAERLVVSEAWAVQREAHLQSNIFKSPRGGHGTRVQSMVLVERVDASGAAVIHFCQRDVAFDAAAERVVAAPWTAYHVLPGGSCVCDTMSA